MKIQLISQKVKKIGEFCCSTISAPQALDSFDINIIFLNDNLIWESKSKNKYPLVVENDLINLYHMMKNSNKTKFIIVLPQDIVLRYDYKHHYNIGYQYDESIYLRYILNKEFKICLDKFIMPACTYSYENNITLINGNCIESSFYFDCIKDCEIITKSENSEKATSIKMDTDLVYTFLKLENEKQIVDFIDCTGFFL